MFCYIALRQDEDRLRVPTSDKYETAPCRVRDRLRTYRALFLPTMQKTVLDIAEIVEEPFVCPPANIHKRDLQFPHKPVRDTRYQ